ncbi:bifunctional serine/threonine-protein kinase/formylglycine-generating enzyme family protein [Candidatus Riflebacteria bacterium]
MVGLKDSKVLRDFTNALNEAAEDFVVEHFIAAGGMGAVYKAYLKSSGDSAALKVIFPGCLHNQNLVKRFEREADIVKKLLHPNLVRYYSAGKIKDYYFLLTEFVDGGSLLDILSHEGSLPLDLSLFIMENVLEGLAYAHDNNCIHRDIKPSNILLSENMEEIKIADFGLAKKYDLSPMQQQQPMLTLTGQILGTLGFMPPEQLSGSTKTLTPASDIFSAGIVFFILLTGETPFGVGNDYRRNLRSKNLPIHLLKEFPVALQSLILGMTRKEINNRITDSHEVLRRIRELRQKYPRQSFKRLDLSREIYKMVHIPDGPFLYSALNKTVDLPEFSIDKYPVTNFQYKQFLRSTNWPAPPHFFKSDPGGLLGLISLPVSDFDCHYDFHPVVNIKYKDARAYAEWAGKKIPTPRQWEKAARGTDAFIYPWGNDFYPHNLNFGKWSSPEECSISTSPVNQYQNGISPYGCFDMAGNAWEICFDDKKNRVYIKGGAWNVSKREHLTAFNRLPLPDDAYNFAIGFRCIRE